MQKLLILLITFLFFLACTREHTAEEKKTSDERITDANEVYLHWAGTNPPVELHVEKGQYWQSGHFSNEYIMYLKLKPTSEWWQLFIKQNKLEAKNDAWYQHEDTPAWFTPSMHSLQYGTESDFDQGSRYFRDTLTN